VLDGETTWVFERMSASLGVCGLAEESDPGAFVAVPPERDAADPPEPDRSPEPVREVPAPVADPSVPGTRADEPKPFSLRSGEPPPWPAASPAVEPLVPGPDARGAASARALSRGIS
jgi:hypothetical protein